MGDDVVQKRPKTVKQTLVYESSYIFPSKISLYLNDAGAFTKNYTTKSRKGIEVQWVAVKRTPLSICIVLKTSNEE